MELPAFLFVDEDPLWLSALRRASSDLPGPKHFARSAEEALRLLREHQPAVLFSGYRLQDEDGLSFLERVRELYPRVACVLHTAHPPTQLRGAPGIALVEKLASPERLPAALRALWVALTGQTPGASAREPGLR
jgi:DNA-binding NarL/FixJ family response regulator